LQEEVGRLTTLVTEMASATSSSEFGADLAASERLAEQLTTRLAEAEESDPPSTPCDGDCEVKLAASEKRRLFLEKAKVALDDEVKRLQQLVSEMAEAEKPLSSCDEDCERKLAASEKLRKVLERRADARHGWRDRSDARLARSYSNPACS
jgi:hypothetical protein